jgi:hypothetical protein
MAAHRDLPRVALNYANVPAPLVRSRVAGSKRFGGAVAFSQSLVQVGLAHDPFRKPVKTETRHGQRPGQRVRLPVVVDHASFSVGPDTDRAIAAELKLVGPFAALG